MEEKNCELLFEYLRSILYDTDVKTLDIDALDAPFQKLGRGLQYLDCAVQEMKAYSAALSKGNLSENTPPKDNFLCENLKNIHANLNHLTWQAKQVAKGDYSQTVSYLGEFSDAFNTMTEQLREREQSLREAQDALEYKAYVDSLTQIGNRHYFYSKVHELVKTGESLVFCYCDLDHLKHINDTYGHQEGDRYLCSFVEQVSHMVGADDVFARMGGDEFCMILRHTTRGQVLGKLTAIQDSFVADAGGTYDKNFSFGIIELPENHGAVDVDMVIQQADDSMYEQKRQHRGETLPFVNM